MSVPTLIIVVSPNPLYPIPSYSSAMRTPDPQSPGLSASHVETKETQERLKGTLMTEPADERNIQMEYSCD
jgi:type VI protein secretion system component VasA